KAVATFGRLDVLVNNAGTAIPKTFEETTLDEMDRVIDINVRGTLVATQAALKHMKPGGRIIMIGSSVGERVLVPGLVAYSAPPSNKTATDIACATTRAICHGPVPVAEISRSPTPTPRQTPTISSMTRRSR